MGAKVMRLEAENARLKAALSAIHDRLHADDVNGAHELCECALANKVVSQPNLTAGDAARSMDFAARFNALVDAAKIRACCVMLLPSATDPKRTSLQLCGEVQACKVVELTLRGSLSLYMGDHARGAR